MGWFSDIFLGWLLGSIVGGLLFDLIGAIGGLDDQNLHSLTMVGLVLGTLTGIGAMRRLRAWREYEASR